MIEIVHCIYVKSKKIGCEQIPEWIRKDAHKKLKYMDEHK